MFRYVYYCFIFKKKIKFDQNYLNKGHVITECPHPYLQDKIVHISSSTLLEKSVNPHQKLEDNQHCVMAAIETFISIHL